MAMQGLLKNLPECDYPGEFLAARLLGRKGALFRNWEFLITSGNAVESLQSTIFYSYLEKFGAPGIWRFLHNEYLWVYRKMNNRLRAVFRSYFAYYESNTLVICLRYLSRKKNDKFDAPELHHGLLHDDIQKILTGKQDFAVMLAALESHFRSYSAHFIGLAEHYRRRGIGGLEAFMRDRLFAAVLSERQPIPLQNFFQYLIDYHNCLSLAKALRWESESEPVMISGGTVGPDRLQRAFFRRDMTPVLRNIGLADAGKIETAAVAKLENALLSFVTGKLKVLAHQRTIIGDILFYLWEQYRYTRNISMILNTVLLDDEPVRENIVA